MNSRGNIWEKAAGNVQLAIEDVLLDLGGSVWLPKGKIIETSGWVVDEEKPVHIRGAGMCWHGLHFESTGDAWNLWVGDDTLDGTAVQRNADPVPLPNKTQNRENGKTPLPRIPTPRPPPDRPRNSREQQKRVQKRNQKQITEKTKFTKRRNYAQPKIIESPGKQI
ncbi:MAG: hypothetical protein JRI84_15170 [Deltaproteobacteria bacterium]|nr:hypothetical protein [Deltaproteobacteria bacterium]